jgi:hypothetical protein
MQAGEHWVKSFRAGSNTRPNKKTAEDFGAYVSSALAGALLGLGMFFAVRLISSGF